MFVDVNFAQLWRVMKEREWNVFSFYLSQVKTKKTKNNKMMKHNQICRLRVCMQKAVPALMLEGFPQFVCASVWAKERLRELSAYDKQAWSHISFDLQCVSACAYAKVLILWEVTNKQRKIVVLLSALWCCIVIHHKPPTETLCCAISLASFPPSW